MSPQKSKPMHCFKSYGKESIKQVRLAGGNHL